MVDVLETLVTSNVLNSVQLRIALQVVTLFENGILVNETA